MPKQKEKPDKRLEILYRKIRIMRRAGLTGSEFYYRGILFNRKKENPK